MTYTELKKRWSSIDSIGELSKIIENAELSDELNEKINANENKIDWEYINKTDELHAKWVELDKLALKMYFCKSKNFDDWITFKSKLQFELWEILKKNYPDENYIKAEKYRKAENYDKNEADTAKNNLRSQIRRIEKEIELKEESNPEIKKLKNEIKQMEKEFRKLNPKAKNFKAQVKNMVLDVKEIKLEIKKIDPDIYELELELENFKSELKKIENIEKRIYELETEISTVNTEKIRLFKINWPVDVYIEAINHCVNYDFDKENAGSFKKYFFVLMSRLNKGYQSSEIPVIDDIISGIDENENSNDKIDLLMNNMNDWQKVFITAEEPLIVIQAYLLMKNLSDYIKSMNISETYGSYFDLVYTNDSIGVIKYDTEWQKYVDFQKGLFSVLRSAYIEYIYGYNFHTVKELHEKNFRENIKFAKTRKFYRGENYQKAKQVYDIIINNLNKYNKTQQEDILDRYKKFIDEFKDITKGSDNNKKDINDIEIKITTSQNHEKAEYIYSNIMQKINDLQNDDRHKSEPIKNITQNIRRQYGDKIKNLFVQIFEVVAKKDADNSYIEKIKKDIIEKIAKKLETADFEKGIYIGDIEMANFLVQNEEYSTLKSAKTTIHYARNLYNEFMYIIFYKPYIANK